MDIKKRFDFFLALISSVFGFCLDFLQSNYWLLLKTTEGTTEHQKWPKIGTNTVKSTFLARKKKSLGRCPPQELEVSPRIGLYLLVATTTAETTAANHRLVCVAVVDGAAGGHLGHVH